MYVKPKGAVRLVMPEGEFHVEDVTRVVVGKVVDPNKDFPKYYFRSIRIETAEGSVEILMESTRPEALQMEHGGGTILGSLKKQVLG